MVVHGYKSMFPISNNPLAMLVDGMTFIQNYQHLLSSMFHELQEKYLKLFLIIIPDNCNCVHFVGDRCDVSPELGLRGEERERRNKISCCKMIRYKPYDTLAIPDWKRVCHNPLNKSTLLNYMEKRLPWSCSHRAAVCRSCIPAAWIVYSIKHHYEL